MTARDFILDVFKAVVLWLLAIIPQSLASGFQFSALRGEVGAAGVSVSAVAAVLTAALVILGLAVLILAALKRFRTVGLPAWTAWTPALIAGGFAASGALGAGLVFLQSGDFSGFVMAAAFSAYGSWIIPLTGLIVLAGLVLPERPPEA